MEGMSSGPRAKAYSQRGAMKAQPHHVSGEWVTQAEIAERLGLTRSQVGHRLKKANARYLTWESFAVP